MISAHIQAWCWQDEWWGLTIEKIRELERETQLALQKKYGALSESCSNVNNLEDSEAAKKVNINVESQPLVLFALHHFIKKCCSITIFRYRVV